jgi:thiol-disulfide isomerase/thioredoxin
MNPPTLRRGLRHGGGALVRAAGAILVVALAMTACSKSPGRELQPGSYRAVVDVGEGRSVPFALDVAKEERGWVLYLVNGEERVRVDEVEAQPDRLVARMPGYENLLEARIAGDELEGTLTLVHASGRELAMPFEAKLGETWRFFADSPADNADMAGRWDVAFTDAKGRQSRGVAELEQRFAQVTGTVIGVADDQRYLAGEVRNEELSLSRFDGGALVSYVGRLDDAGRWVGESWSDRDGARRFVAVRNPDASIDAAAVATQLRNPDEPFQFTARDLDGAVVSSSDPRFSGKPLLVTLAGSWCPNSHDQAVLLVELERRYGARGLGVVSLMFEQHAEFERAVPAVQRFRTARGIDYPTLIAGTSGKAEASRAVPQLDGVKAYPTTLFIDRSGRVRKVHTGFAGPATGLEHEQLRQAYVETIEALLAETP